jgi:NAD(P)-dependent dehydrogenase (short-subunit alcohol dehydrogenase family)
MTTTALITGANKGIGLETARLLGARGMTVVVGARDAGRGQQAEQELRAGGADARFVQLDVTDEASARQAAKWIESEFGAVDILLHNAGSAKLGTNHQVCIRPGCRRFHSTLLLPFLLLLTKPSPRLVRIDRRRARSL